MYRLGALTGLRAIAAYSVLLAHIIDFTAGQTDPALHAMMGRWAHFGMSLFFVLSGFVIAYNYTDKIAAGGWRATIEFFVYRFARLYPLYLVLMWPYFTSGAPDVWSHVALAQSWINTQQAFMPATWSISTEWAFYFVFALIAAPLSRIRRPVCAVGVFLGGASALIAGLLYFEHYAVLAMVTYLGDVLDHGFASADVWYWLMYYSPPVRLLDFLGGVLTAEVYRAGRRVPAPAAIAGIAWCLGLIAFGSTEARTWFQALERSFIYVPALMVVLLYLCQENIASRVLGSFIGVLLGEISYSVYLVQGVFWQQLSAAYVSTSAKVLAVIVGVTAIAIVSYLLIERPGRWVVRMAYNRIRAPVRKSPVPCSPQTPVQVAPAFVAVESVR
jgi:peptidoglycan/LPS O-acetylase OafA/YrhL